MTDLDATLGALRSRTRREILSMVWDRQMAAGDIAAAFRYRRRRSRSIFRCSEERASSR